MAMQTVETHLPGMPPLKIEWATMANGALYTTVAPFREDGSIELGEPEAQVQLTLDNLSKTLEAAGGKLNDLTMVQVFLTDLQYSPIFNELWSKHFEEGPYPNRATVVVSALAAPGMIVECCCFAHIDK